MIEEIYNNLLKDENIKNIYKKIEIIEDKEHARAYHNFQHIKNVTHIVEDILKSLNVDDNTISKTKIACLLHDIGILYGKENHAYRSYEMAKEYFKENSISFVGIEEVLDAIRDHSNKFDSDSIITLALILGDKLDIKKTRITNDGKNVIGNRQYSHIEDIIIAIESDTITIDFKTDNKIDIIELNEYYFTQKVFFAINSFSSKMNLKPIILLDDKEWRL